MEKVTKPNLELVSFMVKHFINILSVLVVFAISSLPLLSSVLIQPISIEQNVETHQLLVEAQVLDQYCYWSKDNLKIMTANELFVYKVFKGEIESEIIVVVTEGGEINDLKHQVTPNLNLTVGQIGLFFLNQVTSNKSNSSLSVEEKLQFYPTSIQQSFIEYDMQNSTARGVFANYPNIEKDLYKKIASTTQAQSAQYTKSNGSYYTEMNSLPSITDTYDEDSVKSDDSKESDNDFKSVTMNVECLYPQILSSGTDAVLTIHGSGFGSMGNASKLEMKNPDTGGWQYTTIPSSHILHWNDEYIEFTLPQKAGSGPVKITNANGELLSSEQEVIVNFARGTAGLDTPLPTMLTDDNGYGGYTLKYSTNTSYGGISFADSDATAPFEKAIETLRETMGFNLLVLGTSTANTYGDDGKNTVMFDNNTDPLNSAAGLLFSQYKKCGDKWEVTGIDVVFRRQGTGTPGINWNFSDAPPTQSTIDFQSVALHEMLHGAQLKHIMEPSAVMYFAYGYGSMRREPSLCEDITGIMHVMQESVNYTPLCTGTATYQYPPNFTGFDGISFGSCPSSYNCTGNTLPQEDPEKRAKAMVYLEGFYNGVVLENSLNTSNLLPASQPFNTAPWYYSGTESVGSSNNIPDSAVDWVLVQLRSTDNEEIVISERAGFINTTGQLMNIDGTNGILFDNDLSDSYYICIHHRTHLSIVTNIPRNLTTDPMHDFTQNSSKAMGTDQLKIKYNKYVMYSGDYDGNGIINNIDYNLWTSNSAGVNIYASWDGNGSGTISNEDYNLWTVNKSKVGVTCVQY